MAVSSRLESFFDGAAGKLLSEVEADPQRSNQHEFNGVGQLTELLGAPLNSARKFGASYVYLDDDIEPLMSESTATWYDARANHPTRTEYRLYYPHNEVMARAGAGDLMIVARPGESEQRPDRELVVVVAPARSTVALQLQDLFGLEISERLDLEMLPSGQDLSYTYRQLLEVLGFEVTPSQEQYLEDLLRHFGLAFPKTAEFSLYARETLPEVDPLANPDAALLEWMDQEESLYRTLERHLLQARLEEAGSDVDRVLEISMQTFQRRRSRAGHALENHVAELLRVHGIRFEAQALTEGRKRPDFLFPGTAEYRDPAFPARQLRMLAVKTTCKDRWRQALTEADRIPRKHLLTLESPISSDQLEEMSARQLSIVVPRSLHDRYNQQRSVSLSTVAEFLTSVRQLH